MMYSFQKCNSNEPSRHLAIKKAEDPSFAGTFRLCFPTPSTQSPECNYAARNIAGCSADLYKYGFRFGSLYILNWR